MQQRCHFPFSHHPYQVFSSSDSSSGEGESDISITKVTHGSSGKSSSLGNLTDSHFDLIFSPTGWLDCDIIHQAQVLLRGENSSIEGFQRPTLGPVRNFDVVSGEFIQILHTGHSHWVCVSSIGCELGHVNLYDSLYHDSVLTQEVEEQTNDLLGAVWLLLILCQCSSKQMEVIMGFLLLHFPPAWSSEKIPHL